MIPVESENQNAFALARRPSSAVEKTTPGAKSILSGMVADVLMVADAQLESWCKKGDNYYFGRGVPKDYSEAARCFRMAGERGHGRAQNNLGVCYATGIGVPQDYAEAVKWYRRAAEQGVHYAQ